MAGEKRGEVVKEEVSGLHVSGVCFFRESEIEKWLKTKEQKGEGAGAVYERYK